MAKPRSKGKSKTKGKGNLMSKLKGLQTSWKKGKPRKAGFPVPDNDYGVEILIAAIEVARSSGRMQINYAMQVLDGDYEGKEIHKYAGLETDDNIDFAMGDLETLELDVPEDIGDLGPVLEGAVGLQVDVTVRTDGSFANVDFNELLAEGDGDSDDDDADDDDADATDDDDDDSDDADAEPDSDDNADDDDDDSDEWPSEDEIKRLKSADLIELAKEAGVDNIKKYKGKSKKLAKAVIDAIYEG